MLVAPVGGLRDLHPDGYAGAALAAREAGTIFILSGVAATPCPKSRPLCRTPELWQQVFVMRDRDWTARQVREGDEAGCPALVWTVSNTEPGSRRRGPPRLRGQDGLQPPWDDAATWADLAWLRPLTDRPIVVKGVQTGADALLATEHGAAAVVV